MRIIAPEMTKKGIEKSQMLLKLLDEIPPLLRKR